MVLDLRAIFREFVCDIVIFLFKAGEALLDTSVRPFITSAVCGDMFQTVNDERHICLSRNKEYILCHRDVDGLAQSLAVNSSDVCSNLNQLPEEISGQVQRQAAAVVVAYRLLTSVPAVILGLFCGAWSDTRGRKLPMMVPSAGSCLGVVFYLLSMEMSHSKVIFLLAGALSQGLFGKSQLISMALNSYVSDTSGSEQLTQRLGRLLGSTFLGVFLGSLLAGILQDVSGLATTFIIVSVCHVCCTLVVLLGVSEVVLEENEESELRSITTSSGYQELRSSSDESSEETRKEGEGGEETGGGEGGGGRPKEYGLFSWEGLRESLMTVVKKREGDERSIIIISLTMVSLLQLLKAGDQDITVLFIQQPPLSWPSSYYGYLTAMDYGVMGLALLIVLPILSQVLAVSDLHLVMIAVFCRLIRAVWAGFCTRTWMMFVSVSFGALGGFFNPCLRSILSKTANGMEMGKLFSIQASLETLSKLAGSGIFTGMYAATVDLFPPAAYLSEVVVYFFMVALLIWLAQLLKKNEDHEISMTIAKPHSSVSDVDEDLKERLRSSLENLHAPGDKHNDKDMNQPHQKRHTNGVIPEESVSLLRNS